MINAVPSCWKNTNLSSNYLVFSVHQISLGGGGLLGLIFAAYLPLAYQRAYPIIGLFCGQL